MDFKLDKSVVGHSHKYWSIIVRCSVFHESMKESVYSKIRVLGMCGSMKIQFLMDLTLNSHTKGHLLIVAQNCFVGQQVAHIKVPDIIYLFFEGKHNAPATLVPRVYCLHYPIIQEVQEFQ